MGWLGGKGPSGRPGWVTAPREVELEIRTVWQEDELPPEITEAPGYRPFTLGAEAQAWVDSMAEVVDGGDAVYGRPAPLVPPSRRSLATHPAPAPPPAPAPAPAASFKPVPARPPVLMPDIEGGPPRTPAPLPVRTLPKRIVMPDIGAAVEPRPAPSHPAMPEIGGEEDDRKEPPPVMPEIG